MQCKGCGTNIHPSVASTTHQAIALLVRREGTKPAKIPAGWRAGPLCFKCQAAWSAKISQRAGGTDQSG